LSNSW